MCVSTLFAQGSCVTAKQVSANYATKEITFELHWTTCNETNHFYRVWVFVDYRPIVNGVQQAWQRATIKGVGAGTWVTGSENKTQTVKLVLDVPYDQFDWCAFAIDYPPNAIASDGFYTLHGTPPFLINNSTTWSARTYNDGCIGTFTDATHNPDGFVVNLTPSITGGTTTIVAGTTTAWTGMPNGTARTWTSGNTAAATVSNSSFVTTIRGIAAGSATITYRVTVNGCTSATTRSVTVNNPVPPITYTNCATNNLALTGVGFTSSTTYSVGGLIWSSPVTVTSCTGTTLNSPNTSPYQAACRAHSTASYGHLFTWCAVVRYEATLCPYPWRVPREEDYKALLAARPSGSGWAPTYHGHANCGANSNTFTEVGVAGCYWAGKQATNANGYSPCYVSGSLLWHNNQKCRGFGLRCVRD